MHELMNLQFILCSDRQFYEVNIRLFVYNILSVQTQYIRNIRIKKKLLIVSITYFLFWSRKLVPKKVVKTMENNSTLEKFLLECNRNAKLLRLVGATFDSKVAFLRRMKKKHLVIPKILQKKSFVIFCLSLLSFELSNTNWKCTENCNMLTERTHDSAVFKIFLNIITICIIIEQYLIEILYEILISIMEFIAIYAIKVSGWIWRFFE